MCLEVLGGGKEREEVEHQEEGEEKEKVVEI